MNAASLLAAETRAEWLKAWRQPAFAVPTLALPLAFYALFAIVLTRPGSGNAAYLLATYGVFAALGPALFAFGAGVAQEREAGQLALKQIAPLPVPLYLGAKLIVCMGFTALVVAGLYALAAWGAGVVLPRAAWAALAAVHVGAALPTGLLGLVIGLRLSGQAAMAVSNLVFLALAVLGGLWMPVFLFPPWMQVLALAMPSHHLAEIALAASGRDIGGSLPGHAAAVAGFMLVFAAGAGWAWRRAAR
ncbi:ABC transporter permease [Rubrivivax gelatinosus]|uniref:Putative ABC transporter permease n=1 Tax=Rubrivivax gelatinosus (strain NBRC 100245 / IL144) TaxID=983917 RepID=I0HQI5_RUBGI|nr:ABC transporter permease [Rubrivivax gelatinosus]MBG6081806.1 ABC-2 type transport system permease protein [Rubrivivax gelatinosus]BAL95272.1 putative ABC transporter permease [Rubrivivax gelatinosus IL144]